MGPRFIELLQRLVFDKIWTWNGRVLHEEPEIHWGEIGAISQLVEWGIPIAELIRQATVSEQTFYQSYRLGGALLAERKSS